MTKRDFIKYFLGGNLLLSLAHACVPERLQMHLRKTGSNATLGHLLREPLPENTPLTATQTADTVIIGGGVAGLTAAYFLKEKGQQNFIVLELDDAIGGNAKSGKNQVSAFPLGAHYLPIPSTDNRILIDFLVKHGLITGFDANNLPIYNEKHLCHDPEERLLMHQYWQEGLMPQKGLKDDEYAQVKRFEALITQLKATKGSDNRYAFAIPIAESSRDTAWRDLDKLSFAAYLKQNNFTAEPLLWYLDYCCRDDYGQTITQVSAFAGLHYFAARRGKGANCHENANLTWAQGNAFLVDLLTQDLQSNIRTQQLVRKVTIEENGVQIIVFDAKKQVHYAIKAQKVILAVPFFIRKRLLTAYDSPEVQAIDLPHQPWLVATVVVRKLQDKKGFPLAWDNVFYKGKTLGFIFVQHQSLATTTQDFVFTIYKALADGDPKTVRKTYFEKTDDALRDEILEDFNQYYPDMAVQIESIDLHLWGHGMVSPSIDFLHHPIRQQLSKPIRNSIFFAHSDYSGISIFEEAFWQGHQAAMSVV